MELRNNFLIFILQKKYRALHVGYRELRLRQHEPLFVLCGMLKFILHLCPFLQLRSNDSTIRKHAYVFALFKRVHNFISRFAIADCHPLLQFANLWPGMDSPLRHDIRSRIPQSTRARDRLQCSTTMEFRAAAICHGVAERNEHG